VGKVFWQILFWGIHFSAGQGKGYIGTRTFENSLLNWAGFMSDETLGSQQLCLFIFIQSLRLAAAFNTKFKQGVCHTVALSFTLKKSILRLKKNYGNSNISP
jgi:hypothetical protein